MGGIEVDKRLSIRDLVWLATVILGVLVGGMKITGAITTNTENAKANIETLGNLDGRVTANEAWILRKEGYDAAVAEMELRNQADD